MVRSASLPSVAKSRDPVSGSACRPQTAVNWSSIGVDSVLMWNSLSDHSADGRDAHRAEAVRSRARRDDRPLERMKAVPHGSLVLWWSRCCGIDDQNDQRDLDETEHDTDTGCGERNRIMWLMGYRTLKLPPSNSEGRRSSSSLAVKDRGLDGRLGLEIWI